MFRRVALPNRMKNHRAIDPDGDHDQFREQLTSHATNLDTFRTKMIICALDRTSKTSVQYTD